MLKSEALFQKKQDSGASFGEVSIWQTSLMDARRVRASVGQKVILAIIILCGIIYTGDIMNRFINRDKERKFLENEYAKDSASFVVIYGRRRIGKTELIKEFIKNKSALF